MTARTLGLVAVVGMVLLGAAGFLTAQATVPGETMQLWEFHTEIVRSPATRGADPGAGSGADATMNSLGRNGWELVAVTRREVRIEDVMQTETLYAFKRPTRTVNR
jgi:hypothetical protein